MIKERTFDFNGMTKDVSKNKRNKYQNSKI